jgi:AcrR family transcriptional regulator
MPPITGTGRASASRQRRRISRETDKRRALLEAAYRVFRQRGYLEATVTDIIREAGVSRATFYGYFSDKDDIFLTLYSEIMGELRRRMGLPGASSRRSEPYPIEPTRLRALVKKRIALYFALWQEEQRLMEGAMILQSMAPRRAARMLEPARQTELEVIRWLRHDKEAGLLAGVEPEVALEALISMMTWFAFRYYVLRSTPIRELTVEELSEQLTAIWFDGVYRGQVPPPAPE